MFDYSKEKAKQEKEKKSIAKFLDDLRDSTGDFIDSSKKIIPKRNDKLLDLLLDVWNHEINPTITEVQGQILDINYGKLRREGLTGNQLEIKLMQFNYRKEAIKNSSNNNDSGAWGIGSRYLKLWEIAKSILESLEKVLKKELGPYISIIIEFIDLLRNIVS